MYLNKKIITLDTKVPTLSIGPNVQIDLMLIDWFQRPHVGC